MKGLRLGPTEEIITFMQRMTKLARAREDAFSETSLIRKLEHELKRYGPVWAAVMGFK